MKTRRLMAAFVSAAMALTMAGAVFAFDANTYLTQTGTIDPTTFTHEGCTGDVPAGMIQWHFVFVLNGSGVVNGHFAFSDGDVEEASTDQGSHQDWTILTNAGVTLDGDNTYTDGEGANFNLSHTCLGPDVTPTPTLPPTSTLDQSPTSPAGTSLTLVFGLILAISVGLVAYAVRPRRATR
jgi:hypothetical protein